jgi:hypothetical protein
VTSKDQHALLALTAALLEERLESEPWIVDLALDRGPNCCAHVAQAGEQAARQLGIRPQIRSGTLQDPRTRSQTSAGWHTWLALPAEGPCTPAVPPW